jgi:hypothetical protein
MPEDLKIDSTKDTLEIICKNGYISLSGNSIIPNAKTFFAPVADWLDSYIQDAAEKTEVTLKFNYIDTASVQSIFDLLKKMRDIPNFEDRVVINWYFEFDDPELLEVGEIMEARLKLKFNYIEFSA